MPEGMFVEVEGAYGRKYTSIKRAREDWDAGKDFKNLDVFGGSYISKDEADEMNHNVILRYGEKLEKIGVLRKMVRK